MAQVNLRNLVKKFSEEVVAVNNVNLDIEDKEFVVLVGPSGCGKTTTLRMVAGLEDISAGEIYIGDRLVNVQIRPIVNGVNLSYRGIQVPVHVYTQREAALAALMPAKAAADTSKVLLCPMPGLVKAINVAEGQEVQPGDSLAVVEAMKMENILRAERKALVKKINAKAGDSLAVDAVIMEFA